MMICFYILFSSVSNMLFRIIDDSWPIIRSNYNTTNIIRLIAAIIPPIISVSHTRNRICIFTVCISVYFNRLVLPFNICTKLGLQTLLNFIFECFRRRRDSMESIVSIRLWIVTTSRPVFCFENFFLNNGNINIALCSHVGIVCVGALNKQFNPPRATSGSQLQ